MVSLRLGMQRCLSPEHIPVVCSPPYTGIITSAGSLNGDLLPMSMSTAELKRLGHPDYWDERYAKVGPDEQVHEWFRSFKDLTPFFDRHLFQVRPPTVAPRILHLGSGDSVSSSIADLVVK